MRTQQDIANLIKKIYNATETDNAVTLTIRGVSIEFIRPKNNQTKITGITINSYR